VPLPELAPDHLVVLVFGPGVGELILARVPPDVWMVVDGCGKGAIDYAVEALARYRGRPRLVVLTHPHDDHSRGVGKVIRDATPDHDRERWPRIGMVLPPAIPPGLGYMGTATRDAIGAVVDRWEKHPPCRWEMHAGDMEPLGDATVRVLSPSSEARAAQLAHWQDREKFDKNEISSALLVSWRGRRLILGSDLVEDPGEGWTASLSVDDSPGDHDLLKVPHHGSDRALVDAVLRPRERVLDPLRLVAPFARKGRLPSFQEGHGVARIVALGGTTYVTGLPRRHEEQSGRAEARSLAELVDHDDIVFETTTTGFPDCYVLVSIPPGGEPCTVTRGPGSVAVTR
jgi:hypothetical protein